MKNNDEHDEMITKMKLMSMTQTHEHDANNEHEEHDDNDESDEHDKRAEIKNKMICCKR